MCSYWFFCFILLAEYIACLSSILASNTSFTIINNYQDSVNKNVGTFAEYENVINSFGMIAKTYKNNFNNALAIIQDISSGKLDAAALPYATAVYLSSTNCEFGTVGDIFVNQYIGFAFSDKLYYNFTESFISKHQEKFDNLLLKSLINKNLLVTSENPCQDNSIFPIPASLAVGMISLLAGGVILSFPLFLLFKKKFIKEKVSSNENVYNNAKSQFDSHEIEFMNMMIKFECILGSSKNTFNNKIEELKLVVAENAKIAEKYEKLLKYLNFQIESL